MPYPTFEQAAAPVILVDTNGDVYNASGGGGGGDASAANQLLEIAELETIAGAVAGTEMQVDVVGALPAGENHIGEIGGRTAVPSANFTRPSDTTAYTSGDLVANSTTAGSVVPMTLTVARVAAGSGMLRKVRLRKSGTGVTNASFRVHFYRSSPTVTNGDNGAWLSNQAANYIGSMDVTAMTAFSDGASGNGQPNAGFEMNFKLPSGTDVFVLVEARGAYTPVSAEVFTLEVEVLQN